VSDAPTGKLRQKGKVKEVYETDDPDVLEFRFTDQISVFDKIIPTLVPRKGETLCRTAAHWFEKANELGFKTHFISLTAGGGMKVKRVDVKPPEDLDRNSTSVLIPLEFICRHYVAGSLYDRIKKGKVNAQDLGFPAGHDVKASEKLPRPMLEVTTKLEEVDRPLTNEEGMELAKLSGEEFDSIMEIVLSVDKHMGEQAASRGLIHVDGKKEFAFDEDRNIMLIDTFGTADEDRFWDAEEYARGKTVELSKEAVRKFYRGSGYHEELMDAREKGLSEPPIPPLPEDFTKEVSGLYIDIYERLTGQPFR